MQGFHFLSCSSPVVPVPATACSRPLLMDPVRNRSSPLHTILWCRGQSVGLVLGTQNTLVRQVRMLGSGIRVITRKFLTSIAPSRKQSASALVLAEWHVSGNFVRCDSAITDSCTITSVFKSARRSSTFQLLLRHRSSAPQHRRALADAPV